MFANRASVQNLVALAEPTGPLVRVLPNAVLGGNLDATPGKTANPAASRDLYEKYMAAISRPVGQTKVAPLPAALPQAKTKFSVPAPQYPTVDARRRRISENRQGSVPLSRGNARPFNWRHFVTSQG